MTEIPFLKMHGLGNDFVIIDYRAENYALSEDIIRKICDRYKGVGCDQLVLIYLSEKADCAVKFYNADGSESGACGNATRCIAHLMRLESGKDSIKIQTTAGLLDCRHAGGDNYTVNMGKLKTGWRDIPLAYEADTTSLDISSGSLQNPVAVNIGNPHAVFFVDDIAKIDLTKDGAALEKHKIFPERANIGVAQIISQNSIKLRVWERGAGETMACGSGACAAVAAANVRGLTGADVDVQLPGGSLHIKLQEDGYILMTGEAKIVYKGVLDTDSL